jgi:hypothetical protein
MWDYATGLPFQHLKDIPQPGSLDAEAVSGEGLETGYVLIGIGCLLFCIRQDRHETHYRWSGQDYKGELCSQHYVAFRANKFRSTRSKPERGIVCIGCIMITPTVPPLEHS